MAKLINDSEAWKSVKNSLSSRGIIANYPSDISRILEEKYKEDKNSRLIATTRVNELLQNLEAELLNEKKNHQVKLENFERHTNLEIEQIKIAIYLLKEEKGFIRKIINKSRIHKLIEKIRRLQKNKDKFGYNLKLSLSIKENAFTFNITQRELLIEKHCQKIKDDILILEQTLHSHEFAGAIAELNLIGLLSKLPENYVVISNINLVSKRFIRFDGEWLRTAQIDHLVVTPAGVFVVEEKNWSKKFSEKGRFYDPYHQVKRASYLCRKHLDIKIKGVTVRSIIAHTGNIPKKIDNSYTKVLLFNEVNNYITWFKERKISDKEINNIANYLS